MNNIARTILLPIAGTALLCCVAVPSYASAKPLAGERYTNSLDEIHQPSLRLNNSILQTFDWQYSQALASCKDL
jgi:hypothetical protein